MQGHLRPRKEQQEDSGVVETLVWLEHSGSVVRLKRQPGWVVKRTSCSREEFGFCLKDNGGAIRASSQEWQGRIAF